MRRFRSKKIGIKHILIIGIFFSFALGYSYLSKNINIKGTSGINPRAWDIRWDKDSVEVLEGSVEGDTPVVNDVEDTVSYTANVKIPGKLWYYRCYDS